MFGDAFVKLGDRVPSGVASAFTSNGRLARLARPVLNRLMPTGETVVSVRSGAATGLILPVMPQSEKYYWSGTHERHVQDALVDLLKPGMTFWDVGAHIGFFTLIAARQVGATGSVLSFEPMPDTRRRLEKSIELNGFRNVSISELAIDASSGTRALRPPEPRDSRVAAVDLRGHTPMWTLGESRGDGLEVPVECRRLDEVSDLTGPPDLVKIDAEGAEIDVLASGLDLLRSGTTKVIVEVSDAEGLRRAEALLPERRFVLLGDNHWLVS